MTLSHTSNLAQKALTTMNVLLQMPNDQQNDGLYNTLSSIRDTLLNLIKFLQRPKSLCGHVSLDSHTFILEQYNSFLKSNLVSLQEGLPESDQRSFSRFPGLMKSGRRSHDQTEDELLRVLEIIARDLIHHTQLLDSPYATYTGFLSSHYRPQHHMRSASCHSESEDRLKQYTGEPFQDRKVRFADHPSTIWPSELEGSNPHPSELETLPDVNAERRSQHECTNSSDTEPMTESRASPPQHISTERYERSDGDICLPSTPPPSYSSEDFQRLAKTNDMTEDDQATGSTSATLFSAEHSEEDITWCNPLNKACRQIMVEYFPTPCNALFDNYSTYRQRIRNCPSYRWYLNFQYLSLVLRPDIPLQVFLVELDIRQGRYKESQIQHTRMSHALAYLFNDCLVFGRSPFVDVIPDPHDDRDSDIEPDSISIVLDSGIAVIDDHCIRFCHAQRFDRNGMKQLVIESSPDRRQSMDNNRQVFRLTFRRTCQCNRVFSTIREFLTSNGRVQQFACNGIAMVDLDSACCITHPPRVKSLVSTMPANRSRSKDRRRCGGADHRVRCCHGGELDIDSRAGWRTFWDTQSVTAHNYCRHNVWCPLGHDHMIK